MTTGLLAGQRFIVTGIASKHSIAYGIAQALVAQGASLVLTYRRDKLKDRLHQFAEQLNNATVMYCDVACDEDIEVLKQAVTVLWPGGVHGVIHSIGHAPVEELSGDFTQVTTREGFRMAHDVSSYSFIALAKAFAPLLALQKGCLLTLSYAGAERVYPNYNVMGLAKASLEASVRYLANSLGAQGIRVNAVSAGAVKTLAASGIKGFKQMLELNAKFSPLKRNITQEEVSQAAMFLCSPWASGITGEVLYVDGGVNIIGMSDSLFEVP